MVLGLTLTSFRAQGCYAVVFLALGLGCSAGGVGALNRPREDGSESESSGGLSSAVSGGSSSVLNLPPLANPPGGEGGEGGTTSVGEPTRCDENGENCKCIAIANIGQVGTSGDTVSFDNWLNTKSNARVDNLPDEFTFDAAVLEEYDILVLQDISTWTVTPDEILAIEEWVVAGNGVMTLQGYNASETEVDVVNSILEPYAVAYGKTPGGPGTLWIDVTGWDPASPIAANMGGFAVAIHNGRPVVDGDGLGLPTLTEDGLVFGVTKQIGEGHVFVWGDEWVTYSSQWTTDGLLRAEQFWYNSIAFLTPTDACQVVIDDPNIIII
jgi:hypothetical protein